MKRFAFLIVAAIVITPGAPAFAKKDQTAKSSAASKSNASEPMSREEAIQTCNAAAAKWRYSDFQTGQITNYRNCMREHGQQME